MEAVLQLAMQQGPRALELECSALSSISSEGLRYLVFRKQKAGEGFAVTMMGASEEVANAVRAAEFNKEIALI